jgi:circadian clock protein KaiC
MTAATVSATPAGARASTGIEGLDAVLGGGFTPDRLYLIEGSPGSGKTTLALQFLLEGLRHSEAGLLVTLSESAEEMHAVAASHGWSLDGLTIRELIPSQTSLREDEQYTMFHPSEVELSETTRTILADIERVQPARVVFDSLSEFRLLSGTSLRYRRQILAMKQFFRGRGCTVVLLDDVTSEENHDPHLQSIAHAVVRLERRSPEYGGDRRRLHVVKFRAVQFRSGFHDYQIQPGGLEVYPRLVASEHRTPGAGETMGTGIGALDALFGGGIERGTSTLLIGAAGTGKSTLATQFAVAAAERGEHAAFFIFDESVNTLLTRSRGLGIDLESHVRAGRISIRPVDPAELTPGEFAHAIRLAVEQQKVAVVVIDSLNGYLSAMPEERFLTIQLHELLMYLGQARVATVMVGAHHGLVGGDMSTPVDASYLADTVVLLRNFETKGEVCQAISVVKKRNGPHERTVREFHLGEGGVTVGEPLGEFRGVLTGVPVYEGEFAKVMRDGIRP